MAASQATCPRSHVQDGLRHTQTVLASAKTNREVAIRALAVSPSQLSSGTTDLLYHHHFNKCLIITLSIIAFAFA